MASELPALNRCKNCLKAREKHEKADHAFERDKSLPRWQRLARRVTRGWAAIWGQSSRPRQDRAAIAPSRAVPSKDSVAGSGTGVI